jgi:hypothetical protein
MTKTATETPGYAHTQKPPLDLILYSVVLVFSVLAYFLWDYPGSFAFLSLAIFTALFAQIFRQLSVIDHGDALAIRFGPIPLLRRTVRYSDIDKVEVRRTLIADGWGIHYSTRGGWVWNLWGRDCVMLHLKNNRLLQVGTDDAPNLARFLEGKIGQVI